ncbi:MAG: cytochrome P450, partial [Planctomycetes bacterium]|nr:cytochrome P450 [Planctomycetota bacterium]
KAPAMSVPTLPDLLSPAHLADPFPLYAELRRERPVFFYEPLNSWVLFRHADVVAAFGDKRLSAARSRGLAEAQLPGGSERLGQFVRILQQTCVMSDAPHHPRMRRVALEGFVPGILRRFRPLVQEELDRLLDGFADRPRVDLMREFARRFPSNVIARLMGVPGDMREAFCAWTAAGTRLFSPDPLSEAEAFAGQQAVVDMLAYMGELAAERRVAPRPDLVSRLVMTGDGAGLSDEEVAILCLEVVGAAHNTTLDFVGNALHTLLTNPEGWRAAATDPSLLPGAVEELFRYAGPILFGNRVASEDLELGGAQIRAGQLVSMFQASANRDPDVFEEPEVFDVRRRNARQHVSFGFGAHYCLGAPLARLEAELVVQTFHARLPGMRLEERELLYTPNVQSRGLQELWVRLH